MALYVSNKNETTRLFKNGLLECLSHIHPATPIVVWVPVILYFTYLSVSTLPIAAALMGFTGGLLSWTLLEYTLHRFIFHYQPSTVLGRRVVFLFHGIHHDYPRDGTRLVMPLLISIPLAVIFHTLYSALFGDYFPTLFAGLVTGYLAYDCTHYAVHHFAMKGRITGFLKIYHFRHHYQDPNAGFGVSNPLWDYVFGTVPKKTQNLLLDDPCDQAVDLSVA